MSWKIGIIPVAIYLLAAIHSTGYHHPDEHFQLIEFAGLKDGRNTGADLTWEYDAQIRPALQPMLALSVFKCLNLFNIEDPFALSMGLRLSTALLALGCIGIFVRGFLPTVKESYRTAFILLSFLLWFLPAVNVRFSSETWAGLMFLLAVALIYPEKKRDSLRYMGIGVLLGLSFVFRFQMAVALSGLFLWLIFIKKEKISDLFYLGGGVLFILTAGTLLDSWFYGNWVFTPWNYFNINIVENAASHFGTSPWYFYLEAIINRPTPLIGILILFSCLLLLFFEYKNIVLWCLLPFLLVHSLIPHKELRFLFPVVNFMPLILILAFQKIRSLWKSLSAETVLYPVLGIALLVNVGGLAMMSFKPAMSGRVNMIKQIHERLPDKEVNLYVVAYSNPYSEGPYKGLFARFYADDKIRIKNLSDLIHSQPPQKPKEDDWIVLLSGYHERSYAELQGFTVEAQSIPGWIDRMNRFYRVYPEETVLLLYLKKSEQ